MLILNFNFNGTAYVPSNVPMLVVGGLQFYDQLGIAFVSNVRTEHDLLRMRKLSSFPQLLMFLLCHDK